MSIDDALCHLPNHAASRHPTLKTLANAVKTCALQTFQVLCLLADESWNT